MSTEEESNQGKSIWEEVSTTDDGEFFIKKSNRSKEKKKIILNPVLHEEIFFNILIRLPPELLHTKFRYVCKQWNIIISSPFFINQSMLRSKPIIIVHDYHICKTKILEIKDNDQLEFSCHPYPQYCKPNAIIQFRSSCNGLLLVCCPRRKGELRVMNPITKQEIILPKCPSGCPHRSCGCGIGFVASTGEYKVVHVYADLFGFEIFTLGCLDNTWRRIDGPFKDIFERPFDLDFRWDNPILVNGSMLHWDVHSHEYIISMDISNEKFRKTYVPNPRMMNEVMHEMGGFLSIFYVSRIGIEVWILKDFEKQVWIKRHHIVPQNLRYVKSSVRMPRLNRLIPVGVVGMVIFFKHKSCGSNSGLYAYDMEFRILRKFKMKFKHKHILLSHLNTLNNKLKALVLEAKPNMTSPGLNLEATAAAPMDEDLGFCSRSNG